MGQAIHPSTHCFTLGSLVQGSPGNRLMSQLSCFLEMLVQLRSRETGCRRMMPLSIRGVMDLQWFRSMRVHNRLSQHLEGQHQRWGSFGEPLHGHQTQWESVLCTFLFNTQPVHIWIPLL